MANARLPQCGLAECRSSCFASFLAGVEPVARCAVFLAPSSPLFSFPFPFSSPSPPPPWAARRRCPSYRQSQLRHGRCHTNGVPWNGRLSTKKDRRVNSHDQHLGCDEEGMTFTLTDHGNKTRKGQATKTCSHRLHPPVTVRCRDDDDADWVGSPSVQARTERDDLRPQRVWTTLARGADNAARRSPQGGAPHRRGGRAHGGRVVSPDAAVPVPRAGGTGRRDCGHAGDVRGKGGLRNLTANLTAKTPSPRRRQTRWTAPDKRLMNKSGGVRPRPVATSA